MTVGNECAVMIPEHENIIEQYAANLDVSEKTRNTYRKVVRYYLDWLRSYGKQGSRADVIEYKAHLVATHSAGTVSVYMGAIRSFYRWMHEALGIENAADGIKGCNKPKGFKRDALTVEQAKHMLAGIDKSSITGMRDYAICNLMIRTGLRTIEVSRADVGDIRNMGADSVLYIQGKGHDSKDEYVILEYDALKPIQEYIAMREGVKSSSPLFASESNRNAGERMSTRMISKICKDSMQNVGIVSDRLTAHSFRHTAVTLSLLGGASLQDARAMARHQSIDTTLIYAHNLDRMSENAGERCISRLLS